MFMAKVAAAVKKVVKKKAVKVEVKEVVLPTKCEGCKGSGLLDRDNLCVLCDGSGTK
jgi:DnaJ-class molecular chaperone